MCALRLALGNRYMPSGTSPKSAGRDVSPGPGPLSVVCEELFAARCHTGAVVQICSAKLKKKSVLVTVGPAEVFAPASQPCNVSILKTPLPSLAALPSSMKPVAAVT